MNLRTYTAVDRAACLALFDGNVPEYFLAIERAEYATFVDDERNRPYFVLEDECDGGRIVGCGGYLLVEKGREAWLSWGMVARDRHRQGLGRMLLLARLHRLCRLGSVRLVRIDTTQHSRGFFERHGFAAEHVTEPGYGPGMHRVDMTLRLDAARCRAIETQAAASVR